MSTDGVPKSLKEVADALALYPPEAFEFVERGLSFTVARIHGDGDESGNSEKRQRPSGAATSAPGPAREHLFDPDAEPRHVSGRQLCEGLRDYALLQWGLLARTVLVRWNIFATLDFGRIVFALVDHNRLKTTEGDTLDDFRNIYDFRTAFESGYRIECKV